MIYNCKKNHWLNIISRSDFITETDSNPLIVTVKYKDSCDFIMIFRWLYHAICVILVDIEWYILYLWYIFVKYHWCNIISNSDFIIAQTTKIPGLTMVKNLKIMSSHDLHFIFIYDIHNLIAQGWFHLKAMAIWNFSKYFSGLWRHHDVTEDVIRQGGQKCVFHPLHFLYKVRVEMG